MKKINLINETNISAALKKIQDLAKSKQRIFVLAKTPEFNRKILENKLVDCLVSPELSPEKDMLKQRSSGLNQVLCKIAKQNNIAIGIDIKNLLSKKEFDLSKHLARLQQNIKLCKKYKVKMVLINCNEDKKNIFALLLTLGMPTSTAKYAVENCFKF